MCQLNLSDLTEGNMKIYIFYFLPGTLYSILNTKKMKPKLKLHMNLNPVTALLCTIILSLFSSCQQKQEELVVSYSDDIYSLKEYKVERHPTLVRRGFGMDIYHEGDASSDTMYLKSDTSTFTYDLLFYNEYAYTELSTGDYSYSGYPVIFMYTDTADSSQSVKAVMVGQGIDRFEEFTYDSIARYVSSLKSDPYIDLSKYRTEVHTSSVDGYILLLDTVSTLYAKLVIGNKFRPDIGGVITGVSAEDEDQIYQQPVFLVKTREGLYAKFMVTRFKGIGADTQKLTLQWQAIKSTEY
jgi:hypothetical protein